MKGYKVVAVYEHATKPTEYKSATNGGRPHEYIPDQWVYPDEDCGPFCVFTDLERAISFSVGRFHMGNTRWEVWECEFQVSRRVRAWESYKGPCDTEARTYYAQLRYMPRYTRLARAVKITRKVQ